MSIRSVSGLRAASRPEPTPAAPSPPSTGGAGTALLGAAAGVAFATTIVLGLRLPPTVEQGTYARLIAIHPPLAWAAYLAFGVCALASALWLWRRTRAPKWDHLAAASAEIGVVFCALTLVTGSIWGRPTWGVWWTWDARLTSTALLLALFVGYLALRRVSYDPEARARRAAVAALVAVADVPIVHFSVDWWRTLHQGRSLAQLTPQNDLDGSYTSVMLLGFLAMTLLYAWLVVHRTRVEALGAELEAESLGVALEERRAEADVVAVAP